MGTTKGLETPRGRVLCAPASLWVRFIRALTSAFLLVHSNARLVCDFLTEGFFVGLNFLVDFRRAFDGVRALPQPTVAAVHVYALGGG